MEYLLLDMRTGRVLSQHATRAHALDEVLTEIRLDGEESVETLALMWRGADVHTDSVSGKDLMKRAGSRALATSGR